MQNLSKHKNISSAAVIVSLASKLPQLYTARLATISKMSGYPSAMHSIGRLQHTIKLDNFKSLLESLLRVQNLAWITAEVIDTMEGTKVDRHQLDKTQIIAYVSNLAPQLRNFKPTADEIDTIASLIVSFEASTSAWVLQGGDAADDLHMKIKELYKEVATASSNDLTLAAFSPHLDSIVPYNKLAYVAEMLRNASVESNKDPQKPTDPVPEQKEMIGGVEIITRDDDASAEYVIYKYACIRLIDHIYQLMLDKDTWYAFVAPRTKADVTTNLERSKTLKNLALYCQSLLSYYQFFSLEVFMKSYDGIQDWILRFPTLEVETLRKLDGTIRKYDLLGAKEDADHLIGSLSESPMSELGCKIFPSELIGRFGLKSILEKVTSKISQFILSGDLTNIELLRTPKYLPLVAGISAAALDVTYALTNIVLLGKAVSHQIDATMAGLLPSMTGGASELAISRFKALSIKSSLPFIIPHATSWHIEKGVSKGIIGNKLLLDSASPGFSQAYHEFVREKLLLKFTTDRQVVNLYPNFSTPQVYDFDKAEQLRAITGYQWKTLAPAQYAQGDTYYDENILSASTETMKNLVEHISGINYEVAILEMSLPHLRKLWATFISSFGLLYFDSTVVGNVKITAGLKTFDDPSSLRLVSGHGQPYGTTYAALEAAQGLAVPTTNFLSLGNGMYIRMLNNIPIVTDTLRLEEAFFDQKPLLYFSSNSAKTAVERWVSAPGLINFALLPIFGTNRVPDVKFSPKFAYLTTSLYFSTDLYYRPSVADQAREVYDITAQQSVWNDDRRYYFLDYIHLGKYSSQGLPADAIPEVELIADAVKVVEELVERDVKEEAGATTGAADALSQSAKAAGAEVDKLVKGKPTVGDAHLEDRKTNL